MSSDEDECSTPGCTLYAGHMQTCNPPSKTQAAPGSLFDKNRCWHEALLESRFVEVGIGYHDSMKFQCDQCGVGIHVNYARMAVIQTRFPGVKTVRGLLQCCGVSLSNGYLPTCLTPYAHAAHKNCPGITEEEEGSK